MFFEYFVMAKSHQLPFTASIIVYKIPLELVFTNVGGFSWIITSNYAKYYTDFLYTLLEYTWFYLLHLKQ